MMAEALREAQRRTATSKFQTFQKQYKHKPAAFVHDLVDFSGLPHSRPVNWQQDILELLCTEKRLAVRGPHGCGKSTTAAWIVLWAILTEDDCKVPTTASAWRHLTKFLWPEIHKWVPRLAWNKIGCEPFNSDQLMKRALQRLPTCEAFAVASNNPAFIEGAHALRICYVYDEAKEIMNETWDASEGAFSAAGEGTEAEAFALAISTPGPPQGRFYDIHKRKHGYEDWYTYHVTLEQAIEANLISSDWAEQRKRQWGEDSALYQNRVLGEFAESSDDVVIPLSWVEQAIERWHEWDDLGRPQPYGERVLGVDIARYGEDLCCIAERIGNVITELEKWGKSGLMASAGRVKTALGRDSANVDVIGIGAGVVDRLEEQGCDVTGVDFRGSTDRMDSTETFQMRNIRAAAWWNMRELLDPDSKDDPILLPDDASLIGDLTSPRWTRTSSGKIVVESKEAIRDRLGHSPDVGDAVVLSFWNENVGWTWRA